MKKDSLAASWVKALGFWLILGTTPLLGGMAEAWAEEAGDGVIIGHSPEYQETTYTVVEGSCRLSWILYHTEINNKVVKHQSACGLPLKRQQPLLARLLARVLATWAEAYSLETLFYGRLAPEGLTGPLEMPCRLALAAHSSARWDVAKGRPRQGLNQMNRLVAELANEAMIYPELKDIFATFGLKLAVSGVEKVLVLEAGKLPFYPKLQEEGVSPQERLPCDSLIWFSISRETPK